LWRLKCVEPAQPVSEMEHWPTTRPMRKEPWPGRHSKRG
jgi:hypothetical protein